jgi:hypothetical protein
MTSIAGTFERVRDRGRAILIDLSTPSWRTLFLIPLFVISRCVSQGNAVS